MANNVEAPNTLISNQRIKIVDVIGEGMTALFTPVAGISGSNPLCSVIFDDTPVMNGDGSPNFNISGQGFRFQYTSGASGQAPMVGFEKVEALIPLPINTRVSFPPPGQGYPQMVIGSFNTSQYPDAEGVKVTTRIPAMYTVDIANGNTNAFSLFYQIDIATNGGDWVPQILGPDGNGDPSTVKEIIGKCTSPYYKTHVLPLPKETPPLSFYEWKVRVRRISQNILSSNTQNELFVDTMAVVSSNTYSYPRTALVGLEISADQFGTIPTRAYDVMGIQVLVPDGYTPTQYNTDGTITPAVYPGIWTGVLGSRKWTDNPAWIFYDLCTNKRYGLGNYIRREWMDKWTLYQIARYCDEMVDDGAGGLEPRFTCNVAIQQPQDAYTLLNNLVSVFRGMLYWANGTIFPVGGETRDPVFNFSNSNVVGGAFSYSDTPRTTRSTVCIIKWNDPDNLFRSTPERVEDPDARAKYGVIEKQITAFATTSRGQAVRAANWILTAEQQLTETIQFQTDLEGVYLRPGDVVNVYDNYRNNQSQGGRLVDFSTGRNLLQLDKPVNLLAGFEYYMAAIVPAATLTVTGLTGSNQIPGIRNSQIETRRVLTPATTAATYLTVDSGFSPALYKGSVWVLSASGSSITVFDAATQYKVLGTSEVGPGTVEVLGVKYQTGINYLVNNNYSVETNPPVVGDTTPPLPPTGLAGHRVTGLLNDNVFFSYVYLDWTPSPSLNTSYYTVSGQLAANPWFSVGQATTTGIQYTPDVAGTYQFKVAAFNANGYGSAYNQATYIEPGANPFVTTAPLSGIFISQNYDPYTTAPAPLSRYTGYLNTQPTFTWNIQTDPTDEELEVPSAQYITGYRARLLKVTDNTTVLRTFINEGKENNLLTFDSQFLYTGTAIKPLRAFTVSVDTLDAFGNTHSGAVLSVNNIQPRAPIGSGFVGYNGGVSYNITPAREADLSGVFIWTNATTAFTPTFDNVTYSSSNMAGFAPAPSAGNIYTWFALVDNYGPSGSIAANGDYNTPIYGPISGNANQAFGTFSLDITSQINAANAAINDAFGLITGTITNSILVVSGENYMTLQTVNGLSGQVVGTTPGAANTALNVRVNTAVVTSSGALSQQIDAVSARLVTTGQSLTATVGTVSTALTNSGIALGTLISLTAASISGGVNGTINASGATLLASQATAIGGVSSWITNLGAQTTGANAQVRIGAEALVTGSVNGLGGVAVARWGFELDAGGKVLSMKATASSFPYSTNVIVFGNADLQSNTYTPGSAGWRINAAGDVEFGAIQARGAFTGGAGTTLSVIDGAKWLVGNPAGTRMQALTTATNSIITFLNNSSTTVAQMGIANLGGGQAGYIQLMDPSTAATITMAGEGGSINCDVLDVDSTSNFDGAATFQAQVNITSTNKLHFSNAGSNIAYLTEDYGVNLYGDTTHPVHVRNASLVRGGTAGGSYGTQNLLNFIVDVNPDSSTSIPNTFEAGTVGGSDHAFTAYLKIKGPGGTTVYVPYQTSAP